MPVVAVAVAVGASVMAGSAVAAVGLTVVTALEVVAAVGATMSAIGSVTGNKTLSKVGMVVGAIGAIGGFAAGAGLLGDAAASNAPLFGPAPADAAAADAAAADTIGSVAGDASATGLIDVPPAPPGGVGTVDAAGNVVSDVAVPTGVEMAGEDASTLQTSAAAAADSGTNSAGLSLEGNTTATGVAPPETPEPSGSWWGSTGMSKEAAAMAKSLPAGQQGPVLGEDAVAGEGSSGVSGIFGKILTFAKNNPVTTLGAIQAGGSMLSGMTSSLTPAQVAAANAQAEANNAQAAFTRQQTANLAMPKAVATSAPITGTPAPIIPPSQPGFMNNAPQQQRITGAPA